MDDRIGKRGDYPPNTTIGGADLEVGASTISLGGGYYCVIDRFISSADRDEIVVELHDIIAAENKPKRTRKTKIEQEQPEEE